MKKIVCLLLVCLFAISLGLWILYYPGSVVFLVGDNLIKLPLWLFTTGTLFILFFLAILYYTTRLIYQSPSNWFRAWRLRKNKRLNTLLVDTQKAYLVGDSTYLEKNRAVKKARKLGLDNGFMALYWQGLYDAGKYKELQSRILDFCSENQKSFICRYYQALIFIQVKAYEDALPMLATLISEHSNSTVLIKGLINCQIHTHQFAAAKKNIIKYKNVLSSHELESYFSQMLSLACSLRDVNAIFQHLPKGFVLSLKLETLYFQRLSGLASPAVFSEALQKRLTTSFDYPLVKLYLTHIIGEHAYIFVKQRFLHAVRENIALPVMLKILVLSHAALRCDIDLIESHLPAISPHGLDEASRIKYLLLNAKLSMVKSKPTHAQRLRAEAEKLSLE